MFEINFSLKNYENEPRAHMAFRATMKMLDSYDIHYHQEIKDELYNGREGINSKRTFYTVYRIYFFNPEDYTTYLLIKD